MLVYQMVNSPYYNPNKYANCDPLKQCRKPFEGPLKKWLDPPFPISIPVLSLSNHI